MSGDDVAEESAGTAMNPTGSVEPLPELPDGVAANIRRQVPKQADRVLSHVATAAALLKIAAGAAELRLAESVAYNVREALDSVVGSFDAGEGGLRSIHAAWEEVAAARLVSEADGEAAVERLLATVKRSAEQSEREYFRARQLVEQVRSSTGVAPFHGGGSMVARYNELRGRAGGSLHGSMSIGDAASLYSEAVNWLTWMFLPPDKRVTDIAALASEKFTSAEQLERLKVLCSNPLQLGRFLSLITDPGWLRPLYDAALLTLPDVTDAAWPVQQLALDTAYPTEVAELLSWFSGDLKRRVPKEQRPVLAFWVLRECFDLGEDGLAVAEDLLSSYGPQNPALRGLGVQLARRCNPQARVVERVARLTLQPGDIRRQGMAGSVFNALRAGVTAINAEGRVKLTAHALKDLVNANPYVVMDKVPLSVDPGRSNDERRFVAHHLVRIADAARSQGVTTALLLEWVSVVPGTVGARLISALLVSAQDLEPAVMIQHVVSRLADDPSGDDRDLIRRILASKDAEVHAAAVGAWSAALGDPPGADAVPVDPGDRRTAEARVWGWWGILPHECVAGWEAALSPIFAKRGHPDPGRFDIPLEQFQWDPEGSSPIPTAVLVETDGVDAAAAVAAWQPNADDQDADGSRRALGRAFERATEQRLPDWIGQADTIVATLNAPLFVAHFLRAVTNANPNGALVGASGPLTAAMIKVIDNIDGDTWRDLDTDRVRGDIVNHLLDLTSKLAGNPTAILPEDVFTRLWAFATASALHTPDDGYTPMGTFEKDPTGLTAAINEPSGRAAQAVLALAAHRYRDTGAPPDDLPAFLDGARRQTGATSPYLHTILVYRFSTLIVLAPKWVDANIDYLIPAGNHGDTAVLEVISHNRPTPALLDRFRSQILALTGDHPESCVYWLLTGAFWRRPGYAVTDVIHAVSSHVDATGELCQQIAFLVQDEPAGSDHLTVAVTCWRAVLDDSTLPREALHKLGHWAFVTNVDPTEYATLMRDTLTATGGIIDNAHEVAERWRTDHNPVASMPIVHALLGHGEPWEQGHIAAAALDCLRAAAAEPLDNDETTIFMSLRDALIDRGQFDAAVITLNPDS